MRLVVALIGLFALIGTALAQPASVTGECSFRGEFSKAGPVRCNATFEFEGFQSDSPSNLRIFCGKTLVFDDDAALDGAGVIIINPDGAAELPSITLPNNAFSCDVGPTVEAVLKLPGGAELEGTCATDPVCGH